jgi:hypothetical protein
VTNDNTVTSNSQCDGSKDVKENRKSKKRGSGGINDYHIYREFRLKMVEAFGSLGAAFYELEREARSKLTDSKPKGEITRFDFFRVVNGKMQLFDEDETGALFAFLTNADLGEENVTIATYKHFGVSDKQWRSVTKQKELENEGHQTGMFASTPQGTSTGLYLRPMHVTDATGKAKGGNKKSQIAKMRNPQKAWEPSCLRGDGPGLNAEDVCAETRGRWAQMSFSVAPCKELKTKMQYPLRSLLTKHQRKHDSLDENTYVITRCPTRRAEMTNPATTLPKQWWPYNSNERRVSKYSQKAITPR